MWKYSFTTIILGALLTARLCNAECNVCNNNGAACISNTTFQLCFSGVAQGAVYSCPNAGQVCTNLGAICFDSASGANIQADCGNTEQCGLCTGVADGSYACTSHNTFVMCQGGEPSSIHSTCPSDDVCLTSRANDGVSPCVSQCLTNIADMCDIISPDATTATPTTGTTESSSGVEQTVCSSQTAVGRYPNPNDATCRTYIYCSVRSSGSLVGILMTCPGTTYFNSSAIECQAALPAGCTQL